MQQRELLDRRVGERLGERALEKAHPVVEQAEALEAVADGVQVGDEVGEPRRRASVLRPRASAGPPNAVGDPDRVLDLVARRGNARMKIALPPRHGAARRQVAANASVRIVVQAALEVVEPRAPDRRVRRAAARR